jgi:mannosyltransferase
LIVGAQNEATAGRLRRNPFLPAILLAAIAAGARLALLDHQSLWFDEVVSATLAKQPFGGMLHDVARAESTPPLYYVVLWGWVRLFGSTALALRSLSVCFGVLTVLVVYAAARLRFSRRAAFIAGALTATHPMLIWYSQETRAYSLVVFFVASSLYFFLRAREDVSPRNLAGWSIAASLGIATHYFAAFVVFPEAALLIYIHRSRILRLLAATTLPLATSALLLPLAIHQRNLGHSSFITNISLSTRVRDTANELVLGNYATSALGSGPRLAHYPAVYLVGGCLVVAAAAFFSIRRRASRIEQHDALLLLTLGLAAFALPLVLIPSAFFYRNLIVVLPPFLLLAGVAFAPRRGRTALAVTGLLAAAALLAPTAVIANRRELQRDDWRDLAALIGPAGTGRAVLIYPSSSSIVLLYYRPRLEVKEAGILQIRELVLVGRAQLAIHDLPKGFRRVEDVRIGRKRIVRLQSRKLRELNIAALHLRPQWRVGESTRSRGQDATLLIDRLRP